MAPEIEAALSHENRRRGAMLVRRTIIIDVQLEVILQTVSYALVCSDSQQPDGDCFEGLM